MSRPIIISPVAASRALRADDLIDWCPFCGAKGRLVPVERAFKGLETQCVECLCCRYEFAIGIIRHGIASR